MAKIKVQRVGTAQYSREQFARLAHTAGFRNDAARPEGAKGLTRAVGIAWRESAGGGVYIVGEPGGGPSHEWSFGVAGINWLANGPFMRTIGITRPEQLLDATTSFRAMYALGVNAAKSFGDFWHPWGPYKGVSPEHGVDMDAAAAAVARSGLGGAVSDTGVSGTPNRKVLDPTTDVGPGPFTGAHVLYELEQAGVVDPAETVEALAIALAASGVPGADPKLVMMYAGGGHPGPSGLGWFGLSVTQVQRAGMTADAMRTPRGATVAAVRAATIQGPAVPGGAALPRNWPGAFAGYTRAANYPRARATAAQLAQVWRTYERGAYPDFNPWDDRTRDVGAAEEIQDPATALAGAVKDATSFIAGPFIALGKFIAVLLNPETWARIGMVVGGAVLVIGAGTLLFRGVAPKGGGAALNEPDTTSEATSE